MPDIYNAEDSGEEARKQCTGQPGCRKKALSGTMTEVLGCSDAGRQNKTCPARPSGFWGVISPKAELDYRED